MTITLRQYQDDAVNAVWHHLRTEDGHPCVVIPTGGGKTPVAATLCHQAVDLYGGRVLILAHVKELLEQSVEKLHTMYPEMWHQIGVYSASLNKRDTDHPIVVAGIQSVYKRACEMGAFDLILIDEAHMIPHSGDGRYRTFLEHARKVNPHVRMVGLTATPYRMTTGSIVGAGQLFDKICYEINVRKLIDDGFLSHLRAKGATNELDFSKVHVQMGEFDAHELEQMFDAAEIIKSAIDDIEKHAADRRSILIFCHSVHHSQRVTDEIRSRGHRAEMITGDTFPMEREKHIGDFKDQSLRFLVNVNVLTTGFDAPCVDCVALLRATKSPGLSYQMIGRGFRLSPETGKRDCLVLDFGGNIARHGPVDAIEDLRTASKSSGEGGEAPAKRCPECAEMVATSVRKCPACDYEFPRPAEVKHEPKAASDAVLTGQVVLEKLPVAWVDYTPWEKRGAPPGHPCTLRVTYVLPSPHEDVSEWICVEHPPGFARDKARKWWAARTNAPMPANADDAARFAEKHMRSPPRSITIKRIGGEKYPQVVGYDLGEAYPVAVDLNAKQVAMVAAQATPDPADDHHDGDAPGYDYDPDDIPF